MTAEGQVTGNNGTSLRHLPNAISIARLACTPVLFWMASEQMRTGFSWLLVAALASDAVDGYLARRFGWSSRLGSLMDSLADAVLTLTAAWGVWVFHREVFTEHSFIIWVVLGMWALQHFLAFLRYGRPSSFHTGLVRITVFIFGCFLVVLFLVGFQLWLFYLTALASMVAVAEEIAMILVMPDWSPDLRGGLLEAIRRRREMRPPRQP